MNKSRVKNFFDYFLANIQVFDPLDRDIFTDDDDGEPQVVSIKAKYLKKYIYELESMNCEDMNIPLSPFKFQEMLKWLDSE